MLHSLACRFSHIRSVSTHTRGSSVTPSTGAVLRNLRPRNAMKRTINDFFAPTPTKKAKYVEPEPGIYIAPVVPPETSKPAVPVPVAPASQVPSSSNELSPEELALIESNRKKALAKQLFNRITEPSWREALEAEFEKPYMIELANFLAKERAAGKTIYPTEANLFTALNICPLDSVKVVMIGQDPYHQPNQAHGLCFSVLPPTKPPSSLRNMYKELKANYPDVVIPKHGNLEYWAKQGILMLNACLTVQRDLANSHQGKGWETFTDACIAAVSKKLRSVIFLLWGSYAQKKAKLADAKKHILLNAVHPSGLSANKGFFGCKHFSEVNKLLKQIGREPIDWQLPESGEFLFGQTAPTTFSTPTTASSAPVTSSAPQASSTPATNGTADASSEASHAASTSSINETSTGNPQPATSSTDEKLKA